ncbi:MAG: pilus assembly PilX N-terminal domain-containing protein [Acidobacteriales bacterium]|nr:pilus assembly PilX N-terminal domain-containing protein [Terriglobales bacterium]
MNKNNRNNRNRERERGFSLIVALLALMLITAVAVGMMFMASTETAVSANFKAEETSYFAARAGVEEVRDRMLPSPPSPGGAFSINGLLPAVMPGAGNPWALYILNGKNLSGANMSMADVTNLTSANKLADDELCHDFAAYSGMTYAASNIRCSGSSGLPAGSSWYGSTTSLAPLPADYKWVRVTLKANNSYAGTNSQLYVDPAKPGANQVCWSGSGTGANQIVAGTGQPCSNLNATPVYLVTALAVTPSGARRMVQQEIAQTYITNNLPGGLFAVGTGCSSLVLAGNAQTGSFNSATENPPTNPPSNLTNNNGDVGSNGNIYLGGTSTDANGNIHTNQPASVGGCPGNGVTVSGSPAYDGIVGSTAYNPAVPPMPNPLPPTSSVRLRNTTISASGGPWGNVTVQGTVTLTGGTVNNPAVYTMNSLTLNGNANLVIAGPVILNLAGVGVSTVLDMTGGSFSNATYVPSSFVINYGGSDAIVVSGGTDAYAAINAPNSDVTFRGGSNSYGQVVGRTINDQGGTNFYWDTSLIPPPPVNTTTFAEVALRELSY